MKEISAARRTQLESLYFAIHYLSRCCGYIFVIALVLASLGMRAEGQSTTKPTDGSTPLGLQAGTPAGSYSLSGFDNVNLYNGTLSFALPLMSIGGRGDAHHTVMLPIERHWMMEKYDDWAENIYTYPIDGREEEVKPGYGPGMMAQRFGGFGSVTCTGGGSYGDSNHRFTSTLTRLSFTGPGNTELEFRDAQTGGGLGHASPCGNHDYTAYGFSRGKVFVSVDGSQTTFIADAAVRDYLITDVMLPETNNISGLMFLADGTRYRIDNGFVTSITDRNGNKLTFSYDLYQRVATITDSLNRQVTFVYDYSEGGAYGVCDKITYKGFGGTTRVIRISKTNLGSVLRSGYSLTGVGYLFSGGGGGTSNYDPTVVSSVWLPDSDSVTRRYQFFYNSYGELARVVLPTGGAFEYDYGAGTTDGSSDGLMYGFPNQQIYRRVLERRVYPDGASGSSFASRTTYGVPENQSTSPYTVGYVTVDERDASNNLLARSKHYFSGNGGASTLHMVSPVSSTSQMDGREYQTDVFDTNGTTVLRRTVNTWTAASGTINPRITETDTTIEPSGANLVSKETFSYDQYNNQTDVYEYDYGSGTAGSLVRHTITSYLTTQGGADYACDPSSTCGTSVSLSSVIHLRRLPTEVLVRDASGTLKAGTDYEYDNYTSSSPHAALTNRSSISGLDSAFSTSYTTRGNVTGTTRYLITSGSLPNCSSSPSQCLSGFAQYDIAGNLVAAIDPRGYTATVDYTDCFGAPNGNATSSTAPTELSSPGKASYAFATTVTNAANHVVHVQFDYYLGKPVDAQDANGINASGYYDDVLDRPTQIIRAVGVSGLQNHTTFAYDDANRTITTTGDLTSSTTVVGKAIYDPMGRNIESRQYEGSTNYIVTKTDYDVLGRAYRTSNPYRPLSPDNESAVWNTFAYDALGRTISATTADGAVVTTSYSGNAVTATDQAGKVRRSVTDALGRILRVDEPNSSGNLDSGGSPVQSTSYTYSVLNDLTQVTQGSQTRTFAYDSLKRMTSATNPESGTVTVDVLTITATCWSRPMRAAYQRMSPMMS